jgi:hypothetical protein
MILHRRIHRRDRIQIQILIPAIFLLSGVLVMAAGFFRGNPRIATAGIFITAVAAASTLLAAVTCQGNRA